MTDVAGSALLLLVWVTASWWWATSIHKFRCAFIVVTLSNLVVALLWHPTFHQSALKQYSADSINTLSLQHAIGLVFISLLLTAFVLFLSWSKSRFLVTNFKANQLWAGVTMDFLLTIALFWVCTSLAPQLYYQYYQQILPGLPEQWVVRRLLSTEQLLTLARIRPGASLADHSTGLVLWIIVLNVVSLWGFSRWQSQWRIQAFVAGIGLALLNLIWRLA